MTLLGWIAWNFYEFKNAKDDHDDKNEKFDIGVYIYKKWDNWVWTLLCAFILLVIGHNGLGLDLVRHFGLDLQWSDLYYLCSGFASEAVSFLVRKFKNKTLVDK